MPLQPRIELDFLLLRSQTTNITNHSHGPQLRPKTALANPLQLHQTSTLQGTISLLSILFLTIYFDEGSLGFWVGKRKRYLFSRGCISLI